jgi:heme O synthase-like polyprenyltransferase
MSTLHSAELTLFSRANAYVELTKPDVSFLVVMTTAAGYYMGCTCCTRSSAPRSLPQARQR